MKADLIAFQMTNTFDK